MDVRYINPFVESVRHLFSTMLETDLIVSKPLLTLDPDEQRGDVSAVIEITGDATGWVALRFPMRSAVTTAGRFAQTDVSSDQAHLLDALGEMANIVAGRAKAKLNDLTCQISTPRVALGTFAVPTGLKGRPRLVLPCDSQLGRFCVEVELIVRDGAAPATAETSDDEAAMSETADPDAPVTSATD